MSGSCIDYISLTVIIIIITRIIRRSTIYASIQAVPYYNIVFTITFSCNVHILLKCKLIVLSMCLRYINRIRDLVRILRDRPIVKFRRLSCFCIPSKINSIQQTIRQCLRLGIAGASALIAGLICYITGIFHKIRKADLIRA